MLANLSMRFILFINYTVYIAWPWQLKNIFIQKFRSLLGCQTCMCKRGIKMSWKQMTLIQSTKTKNRHKNCFELLTCIWECASEKKANDITPKQTRLWDSVLAKRLQQNCHGIASKASLSRPSSDLVGDNRHTGTNSRNWKIQKIEFLP